MKLPLPTILGLLTASVAVSAYGQGYGLHARDVDFGDEMLYERDVDFGDDMLYERDAYADDLLGDVLYKRQLYADALHKRAAYEDALEQLYPRAKGTGGFSGGKPWSKPAAKPGTPVKDNSKFPGTGNTLGQAPGFKDPKDGAFDKNGFKGIRLKDGVYMPPIERMPEIPDSP